MNKIEEHSLLYEEYLNKAKRFNDLQEECNNANGSLKEDVLKEYPIAYAEFKKAFFELYDFTIGNPEFKMKDIEFK